MLEVWNTKFWHLIGSQAHKTNHTVITEQTIIINQMNSI